MEFNFNENLTVPIEKWAAVPEDFKGLYEKTDEGYKLRSEDPGVKAAISAITGLNKALVASRAEARDAKSRKVDLSALEAFGDTSDLSALAASINERIEEASKSKNADVESKVTKIKQDLSAAHTAELEKMSKRNEALRNQLYTNMVESAAVKALADAGAIDADLVLPMIKTRVGVSEEEGRYQVRILDESGDPRYSGATGEPMSITELVMEMKGQERFGPLFKSEKKSGGDLPPQNGRHAQNQVDLSPTDKIAAGLKDMK